MSSIEKIVGAMRQRPKNIRYADLLKVCEHYFGEPRTSGGSHAVFRTPRPGDPRVNIQNDKGQAKPYQVRQVPHGDRQDGGREVITHKVDVSHYTYRVAWSPEDEEYVATCVEFPSLSWLADSQPEALVGLLEMVEGVVRDMTEQGEKVPEPLVDRSYSGKFNLRVGEKLHRDLALRAAEEQLSLNQYVVRRLTSTGC